MTSAPEDTRLKPEHIRVVRLGHGANCSSVGSVIDTLFLTAAASAMVYAAVCASVDAEAAEPNVDEGEASSEVDE